MAFADLVAGIDRAVQGSLGGVAIFYQSEVGEAVTIQGIFDEKFSLFTTKGEVVGPAVFVRLEDVPMHPRDDDPVLTIGGYEYRVRAWEEDGFGGLRLVLLPPAAWPGAG